MVTRPDEPMPPENDPEHASRLPDDATDDVEPPIEVDTEKLRVKPEDG